MDSWEREVNVSRVEAKKGPQRMTWLLFALMTVVTWGLYGIFLHRGQLLMGDHPTARYKAFLLVGVAYFVTAVVAPLVVLWLQKSDWRFPAGGMAWSLTAGVLGAIGAFGVLLAFGAYGSRMGPPVVMSIIFAGAPVVNAVVALWLHPPTGGVGMVRWPFVVGLVMAAAGGFLVTRYRDPVPSRSGTTVEAAAASEKTP